jgi:ribosome-associated translation inhibitor RaiA
MMEHEIRITSRDFALTPTIEALIRKHAERLDNSFDRITSCHVVLSAPAVHHHHKGGPFDVHVVLHVPGSELAVNHQHGEDLSIAVRDAFDSARRKLQDYVREMRGEVKRHDLAS